MIEETISESPTASVMPPSPKVHRIGLYNRLAIMTSATIITLSLLISWVLWLTVFRSGIDYYIAAFNSAAPSNLQINFEYLSIIIFAISALAIGLSIVSFLFIRTKNSFSALFSLISFIFSTLLVVGIIIFAFIRFNTIKSLIQNDAGAAINTIGLIIAVFLPWAFVILSAIFLVGNSIWLLINITSKYRSNAFLIPIVKPKEPTPVIEPTPTPQESEITIPLASQQSEAYEPDISIPQQQLPISITVTNNTTLPQNQQSNIQSQDNFETTPSVPNNINNDITPQSAALYTSPTVETSSNTGAYVSEAVVSNQNLGNNNENNRVQLTDPILEKTSEPEVTLATSISNPSIYSRPNDVTTVSSSVSKYDDLLPDANQTSSLKEPEISSNNASSVATSYEPQNQGGFDVQGVEQKQPDASESRQEKSNAIGYEYNSVQQKSPIRRTPPPKSKPASKVSVNHWTLEQIQTVWEKAETIDGVSDKLYRKDYAGAWMFRDSFTNDLSEANNEKTYSWTIVLHRPVSQHGTTELYNLDPMNIVNAKNKGENYPRWTTKISSKGNENIVKEQNWKART